MPDVIRTQARFNNAGIHLTSPIDRMLPGKYAYLFNARMVEEGRIEGRPGYQDLMALLDLPNSIRRLNDVDQDVSPVGYTYVGGGGGNLYAGQEPNYAPIDSGYSGDPLSLLTFRPEASPEAYMYVFDRNKSAKVAPDGSVKTVGIPPPITAPVTDYGVPHTVDVSTGQSPAGWAAFGNATGPSQGGRTGGTTSISFILYNSGDTGWACVRPSTAPTIPWAGERMKITLNLGAGVPPFGNQEDVVVREIHPPIISTTLESIAYDTGNSGLCSLTLVGSPSGLERNSMIQLGSEAVRVLEVNPSPGGVSGYSVRCVTTIPHAAGEIVFGLTSWYMYTTQTHHAGENMSASFLLVNQATPGSGGIDYTFPNPLDASKASSIVIQDVLQDPRTVDPANDWLHISLYFVNPPDITSVKLMLCYDAAPVFSFTNPGNSSIFSLTPSQYQTGAGGWAEVVIPIASGVRTGSDFTRGLSTVTGIAVQATATVGSAWGLDWWYLFGTYGPTILPNSPVGMIYAYRYRDSTTQAHSVPSPFTRYQLFPLREAVIVNTVASPTVGVDTADIYRQGGTVTSPLYVGSTPPGVPFTDSLDDTAVLSINQPPDVNALQPWPIQQVPWMGRVNVVGTTVTWVGGHQFNTNLIGNTIITINGVTYTTFGQPSSPTQLQITQNGGFQTNVPYTITSPTLAGQALPFAFGPLEGPFAPVFFALGDPINGGLLYFSNFSDLDSASDTNTLELSSPSSDLISGAVFNGIAFAGSRDELFAIRFSYLTQIGATPANNSFQWFQVPAPSGVWSRWACCYTPIGVAYLGRDGIYIATESGAVNISNDDLYPLFPHDGQPAKTVQWGDGSTIIPPVDMTKLTLLRLSYCDEAIRFSFVDTGGNYNTLIYQIPRKRWHLNNYANPLTFHYLVEASSVKPNDMEILSLSLDTRTIVKHGGNTDNGKPINSVMLTPCDDGGDERSQKLYVDSMHQVDGVGSYQVAPAYDNAISFGTPQTFTVAGFIKQDLPLGLSSQPTLTLHRNIGMKYFWTGGPDGPRFYAWESSGYAQPYLSVFHVIQIEDMSFPGWKHVRRMYPALISTSPILLSFLLQDGRTFGPYTIPSTGGRYKQFPQMVNHGLKDLAYSIQLDGQGQKFAFFPSDFVMETKEWNEETFIKLAVFRA